MKEKSPPAPDKRCQHRNSRGECCRAPRMHGSIFCFFHDPEAERGRRGLGLLEELRLGKPSAIHEVLVELLEGVRKKRVNPQQAYAAGWLVQLLLQNLAGLKQEAHQYEAESYGRLVAGQVEELLQEARSQTEEDEEDAAEEGAAGREMTAEEKGETDEGK